MKKLMLVTFMLCLLAGMAVAQNPQNVFVQTVPVTMAQAPAGTCNQAPFQIAYVPSTKVLYTCDSTANAWVQSGAVGSTTGTGAQVLATSATLTTPTVTNPTVTTGTFTTPALTNPVVTGPAPVACGATCSPTSGQLILMNLAAGATVTLPTSAGTGNVIRMRISTATTSAAEKVLLTTTADVIIGTAIGENAGTAKVFVGNAGTFHSIQMPFAGSQPSGGFIGDQITCTDIATGTWACDINYQAGATPTTPYSTSTT